MPQPKKKESTAGTLKQPARVKKETEKYFEAVGRRKTAVARIRILDDSEKAFVVNDKAMHEYCPNDAVYAESLAD